MSISLVIVESPAKANTIKKYLGRNFKVKASIGHVIDLPVKKLGVDIENDFKPEYQVIKGKAKVLDEIKKIAASADKIYLAPDPDREGEAIAWHIWEYIKRQNKNVYRVLFNEITKKAVQEAISRPESLNKNKYHAQQARRIMDRLVGYKISPILWKKVGRGLSAGRVQSVALRMIVDREREIKVFKSEEYWSIVATLLFDQKKMDARLIKIDGKKVEINNEKEAKEIVENITDAEFCVENLVQKERHKWPVPPFITAKLQQDAARKLGFTAKKTMLLAQRLYEGIEVGETGPHGLITYMRTDSTRVSNEAISEARHFISKTYGPSYLPKEPNVYKSKKTAQEAHEAIRPTSMQFSPSSVKSYLERDMLRLYELIWNRFVASQMAAAVMDQTVIDIYAMGPKAAKGKYLFRATGQVVKFLGFLAVYKEERDEIQKKKGEVDEPEDEKLLPAVKVKDVLGIEKISPHQHFTEPPPRYSEASLVKALEENGIGRPSTYASILSAIQNRAYVAKEEERFCPTELGILVTDLLVEGFPQVLNVEFTARMEEELDLVEDGKMDWVKMLKKFYGPFSQRLEIAQKEMRDVKREEKPTRYKCDKCGSPMVIKWGRRGEFLACSSYPDCKNTKEIQKTSDGDVKIQKQETVDEKCEKCQSPLAIKHGRFGRFLACTRYPECKFTKSFTLGIKCAEPGCGGGLVEKRSRKGKIFYSCSNYPKCKFATWYTPLKKQCPACKAPFLVVKMTKGEGKVYTCLDKSCNHKEFAAE